MTVLLFLFLVFLQTRHCGAAFCIESKVKVIGELKCNGAAIAGVKVSMMEKDYAIFNPQIRPSKCKLLSISDGDDFMNATVTDEKGRFTLFAHEREFAQTPDFYVWIALSCDLIMREKVFTNCPNFKTSILQQCDGATNKFIYTKLMIDDNRPTGVETTSDKYNINLTCNLDLNMVDFKLKEQNGNFVDHFLPQTELVKGPYPQHDVGVGKQCNTTFYDV